MLKKQLEMQYKSWFSAYKWYQTIYTAIAFNFNERVTFWLQPPGHCLVRVFAALHVCAIV